MPEEEEFELVPLSPLRRLEKRLEKVEEGKGGDTHKFFSELVEIVRMNQEIVDEMAKANDALRIEVGKLPGKLEELISNMNELVSYIKAAGAAGGEADAGRPAAMDFEPLLKKMDMLIEGNKKIVETNDTMISNLENLSSRLKRPGPVMMPGMQRLPPLKKPMPL